MTKTAEQILLVEHDDEWIAEFQACVSYEVEAELILTVARNVDEVVRLFRALVKHTTDMTGPPINSIFLKSNIKPRAHAADLFKWMLEENREIAENRTALWTSDSLVTAFRLFDTLDLPKPVYISRHDFNGVRAFIEEKLHTGA